MKSGGLATILGIFNTVNESDHIRDLMNACLKLHHAAKKTKYKSRSIFEYYVTNNYATHRLKKKHFSLGFRCK